MDSNRLTMSGRLEGNFTDLSYSVWHLWAGCFYLTYIIKLRRNFGENIKKIALNCSPFHACLVICTLKSLLDKCTLSFMQSGRFPPFSLYDYFTWVHIYLKHGNDSDASNFFHHRNTSPKKYLNNVVYWFRLSFLLFDYNNDFFLQR